MRSQLLKKVTILKKNKVNSIFHLIEDLESQTHK